MNFPFSSTIFPALLLAYLATLLVIQCANETNRTEYRTKLLLIGVILGCLVLFRYDVAVYVGLALGAILIGNNLGLRLVSNVELFARLFSGSALILVLPVLGLLTFVPFAELREQLFEFPLKIYPVYRSLALPGVLSSLGFSSVGDLFSNLQAMTFSNFAQFYFPYISIVLSAGLLIYRMFRRDSNSYSRAQISILSLTLRML